ncbi:MAG: sensor histidine kinase, partial [Thiohalomonadales bacterium]
MIKPSTFDAQTILGGARQPLRGPFMRWPRTADTVLACLVFLASVFLSSEGPNQDLLIRNLSDMPITGILLFAVASVALYWRRYQPLLVLGLILATLLVSVALAYPNDYFALPIAVYSVGRYVANDRNSDIAVATTIATAAISELVNEGPIEDIGGAFFILFLVWYIGRRIQIRGDYVSLLQDRATQLEREQENEARRAVAEERTRIARELHDVVAHQVSLMTVQAGAAKTVAAADPEAALQAMEAVENAGREALDELRHLLAVLRPKNNLDGLGPQPGVADIPRLVEQLAQTGLKITLSMQDVPSNLPARVDLSSYRIVQEALTNVLKHAEPNTKTEVRLSTDYRGIAIEVLDNGSTTTILPGAGHGIVGMQERAQLLTGSLIAGPRPGGGFQVIAHL